MTTAELEKQIIDLEKQIVGLRRRVADLERVDKRALTRQEIRNSDEYKRKNKA